MPTLYTKRNIIVVNAADAAAANTQATLVDILGGANTFTVPLSATGSPPATHYWCNWAMTVAEDADIRARLQPLVNTNRVRIFDALTTTPEQVLVTLGLHTFAVVLTS